MRRCSFIKEAKLLEIIRDLEEKNNALTKNYSLVFGTLQVCGKEIDKLAAHNRRMVTNLVMIS